MSSLTKTVLKLHTRKCNTNKAARLSKSRKVFVQRFKPREEEITDMDTCEHWRRKKDLQKWSPEGLWLWPRMKSSQHHDPKSWAKHGEARCTQAAGERAKHTRYAGAVLISAKRDGVNSWWTVSRRQDEGWSSNSRESGSAEPKRR